MDSSLRQFLSLRGKLVAELRNRGLSTNGKKNSLQKRLKNVLEKETAERENDDESLSDEIIGNIDEEIRKKQIELEKLIQKQLDLSLLRIPGRAANDEFVTRRKETLRPNQVFGSTLTLDSDVDHGHCDGIGTNNGDSGYRMKNMFTFRDIENSMNCFCGSDNYGIDTFIDEFEQNAGMLRWNDYQKVVVAVFVGDVFGNFSIIIFQIYGFPV